MDPTIPLPLTPVRLIIHLPHVETGYLQFLANLNLSLEEIMFEIINILTPDGTESAYYNKFDEAIIANRIVTNTPQYLEVYTMASKMYVSILEQVSTNPFVELIMSGTITSFQLFNNSIYLIISYHKDYDEYDSCSL